MSNTYQNSICNINLKDYAIIRKTLKELEKNIKDAIQLVLDIQEDRF